MKIKIISTYSLGILGFITRFIKSIITYFQVLVKLHLG